MGRASLSCRGYDCANRPRLQEGVSLVSLQNDAADCPIFRTKFTVTGSLAEFIIPPYFRQPPALLGCDNRLCVGPVLSVPDSSAPSPPGSSGSGLTHELIPILGQRKLVLFLFGVRAKQTFSLHTRANCIVTMVTATSSAISAEIQ